MKMKIREVCLVMLISVGCFAEDKSRVLEQNGNQVKTQMALNDKRTELIRHKRGWGSVLFKGASILVKTTSLGLELGAALTEGCMLFPSICTNKHEIERLNNAISTLTQQYEAEYLNMKRTYYDLRRVTANNGYLEYYINQIMQTFDSMQDIEGDLCSELELKVPAFSKNFTFEQYLGTVVSLLEFRLSDIKELLHENQYNAIIDILAQYVIEATLKNFINLIQTAYQAVDNGDIVANTDAAFFWERLDASKLTVSKRTDKKVDNLEDTVSSRTDKRLDDLADTVITRSGGQSSEVTVTTTTGKFIKLILVPRTLKQMVENAGQSLRYFGKSIRNWEKTLSWHGLKNLRNAFKKPLNKLLKIKTFLNPKKNNQFVQNYKLQWSEKIMLGLDIAGDIITQITNVKDWATVSTDMKKARQKYELYLSNLQNEMKNITEQKKIMDQNWIDSVEVFHNLSTRFKSLITNATNFRNFSDSIGLTKLPVDTSTPLFTIDFDHIDKQSMKAKQLAVISFLKSVNYNVSVIEDQMRARRVLYNYTSSHSESGEPVFDMLADVKNILNFSPSMTMQAYGQKLKLNDMVCTVAILRSDLTDYDFYPLDQFRPRCEVSASTFENLKTKAMSKRKTELMRSVIKRSVISTQEKSLSRLTDIVHKAYSGVRDKSIAQFGASISDRDIVCLISKEFASLHIFDFILLDPFRPDCSAVTSGSFNKMLHDGSKMRALTKGIQNDLNTCVTHLFCPCLAQASKVYHAREADIISVLLQINPHWKPNIAAQSCGHSGCNCRHL